MQVSSAIMAIAMPCNLMQISSTMAIAMLIFPLAL
jgi:hypothetical protein